MNLDIRITRDDILGAGAVAIISTAGYFWGIEPVRAARAHAVAQEALLAQSTSDAEAREHELVSLRDVLRRTRERADDSITLSPASLLNQRLTEIPSLASRQNVKLAEIQPGAPVPLERLGKLPIRFSGEGTFPDVVKFVDAMDTHLPDVEVVAFSIYSQSSDGQGLARFSADVVWYTQPVGASKTPAKAAQGVGAR